MSSSQTYYLLRSSLEVWRRCEARGSLGTSLLEITTPWTHRAFTGQRDFLERKPENVKVIADSLPISAVDGVELVGAPWPNKRPLRDLVKASLVDARPSPGTIRIAVGHGAVDVLAPDKQNPANICLADAGEGYRGGPNPLPCPGGPPQFHRCGWHRPDPVFGGAGTHRL